MSGKWPTVLKLLRVRQGDVLNVGANVGQEIPFLLKNSSGCVFAIEAVLENSNQIYAKFRNESRVHVSTRVMAAEVGPRTFYINNWPGTHSLLPWNQDYLKARGVEWHTVRQVQVTTDTLDEFCKIRNITNVALLFMDLQGAELEVLHGAEGLLAAGKIDLIMGEQLTKPVYKGVPPFSDVLTYLDGFGYKLVDTFRVKGEQFFDFLFKKGAIK